MSRIELVTMPKWGLSMEQGEIRDWHRAVGDAVRKGDELVDIETSKITNVLESPADGTLLRIVADTGTVTPCGDPVAVIGSADASDGDIAAALDDHALRPRQVDAGGPVAPQATVRVVTIYGAERRVRVLELGGGAETVLFLHGFGGDLENWMLNLPAIAATHRVLACDLAGHGGSGKDVGDGTAAKLAQDILAVLDAADIGPLHIVSHSFGAMVAGHIARARLPESFIAIAPADLGTVERSYIDRFIGARRRSEMAGAVEMLFADPALATAELTENLLRYKRIDGVLAALRAIDAANLNDARPDPDAVALWEQLGSRGLVVWGAEDAIVPVAALDAVPPGTARRIIAGAGHMPQLERAEEVNSAILGHITREVLP
jgi:pyruvate dehydrogenase E2 component (dihydrolipoamide acetyltransferase)